MNVSNFKAHWKLLKRWQASFAGNIKKECVRLRLNGIIFQCGSRAVCLSVNNNVDKKNIFNRRKRYCKRRNVLLWTYEIGMLQN